MLAKHVSPNINVLFNLVQVIWLSGNPLCNEPGYREEVSKMLPQVMMLDNKSKPSPLCTGYK